MPRDLVLSRSSCSELENLQLKEGERGIRPDGGLPARRPAGLAQRRFLVCSTR